MDAIDRLIDLDLDRFYTIYDNVHHMMKDRGYKSVSPQLSIKEFKSNYLGWLADLQDQKLEAYDIIDELALIFVKKKRLLVYFHVLDSKLCQNDITCIHKMKKDKDAKELIIVAKNRATPKVSGVLSVIGDEAQLFSEDELLFNPTKHQLVSKHVLLNKKDRDDVIKRYAIVDNQTRLDVFPALLANDAIAKYYHFKPNDIIRIERPRPDGYIDISYRVVIKD